MITLPGYSDFKATIYGYWNSKLSDWSLSARDLLGKLMAAHTLSIYSFLQTARKIDLDAVPTENTSSDGLNVWAESHGLSNGAGGYGRKAATTASGGTLRFTGVGGTVYPMGTTLTKADGVTKFETTAAGTVSGIAPATGFVDVAFDATTAGAAGDVEIGETLQIDSVPVGGDSSAEVLAETAGGANGESDAELLGRIQDRVRNPPKAITANDLQSACESVSGVSIPYMYPCRSGTGSVDVVLTQTGTGTGRAADAQMVLDAQAACDAIRNVALETVNVLAPGTTGVSIVIRATESSTDYAWEWDDSGGPYTVDTYPNADDTHLLLDALAPASLKAATPADPIRIQVAITGSAVPVTVRVTGYADVGGKTNLTLEEAISPAPTAGDRVRAGSALVDPVAAAVDALFLTLGPSKASGFADESEIEWDDTIRVDQLRRVVLDATDADGKRVVIACPAAPTINGAGTDLQAADVLVTAPRLLYPTSIVVTP